MEEVRNLIHSYTNSKHLPSVKFPALVGDVPDMLQTKAGRCLQQLGYFKVSKSASVGGSPQPLLELRFTIPFLPDFLHP